MSLGYSKNREYEQYYLFQNTFGIFIDLLIVFGVILLFLLFTSHVNLKNEISKTTVKKEEKLTKQSEQDVKENSNHLQDDLVSQIDALSNHLNKVEKSYQNAFKLLEDTYSIEILRSNYKKDEEIKNDIRFVTITRTLRESYNRLLKQEETLLSQFNATKKLLNSTSDFRANQLASNPIQLVKDQTSQISKNIDSEEKYLGDLITKFKKNLSHLSLEINEKNGDIIFYVQGVDFLKYQLSQSLQNNLNDFIIIYLKILFENEDILSKLNNIEIIGHASPTYKKHYTAPVKSPHFNQAAFDYNMSVSFQRAHQIYQFLLQNSKKQSSLSQEQALKYFKVIGKGFIDAVPVFDDLIGKPAKCIQYDCFAQQKIVFRLNFK